MIKYFYCLALLVTGAFLCAAELKDPGFSSFQNGASAVWKNGCHSPVKAENGTLYFTATAAKFNDSIYQGVRVVPGNSMYVFAADVDAPVARKAYLQIKFYKDKKELKRCSSSVAPAGKSRLIVCGFHPEADMIEVAMRIFSGADGKEFKFSAPALREAKNGELFGNWMAVGKGFTVTDMTENSFTVNVTGTHPQHAAVLLTTAVTPNKKMTFSADVESEIKAGYLEVKLFNGSKMIARKNSIGSAAVNGTVNFEFETGNANSAILHCRVPLAEKYIGKSVKFSNLKLAEAE